MADHKHVWSVDHRYETITCTHHIIGQPPCSAELEFDSLSDMVNGYFALVEEAKAECIWTHNDDDYWQTECWNAFQLVDGKPSGNYMIYCPYCGRKLAEAATQSEESEA